MRPGAPAGPPLECRRGAAGSPPDRRRAAAEPPPDRRRAAAMDLLRPGGLTVILGTRGRLADAARRLPWTPV